MARRALVLGGGGIAGGAWEMGLLAGLDDGGLDLLGVDAILGTSAGSVVGAQLASGRRPRALGDPGGSADAGLPDAGGDGTLPIDVARLTEIAAAWGTAANLDAATSARIGAMSRAAGGFPQEVVVPWISAALVGIDWADKLSISAVDVDSGALRIFRRDDDVDLGRVVSASCAVPGFFAPVDVDGRTYMDGSVRSSTCANWLLEGAAGCNDVLIVAPLCDDQRPGVPQQMARCLETELRELREHGVACVTLTPNATDRVAFGDNVMDPATRSASRAAGYARGTAAAKLSGLASWRAEPADRS